MARSRIVFWQAMPSPHQANYIRALAEILPNASILGVYDHPLEQNRRDLGWSDPDFGRVQTVISPDRQEISRIALDEPENSIHIFSGFQTRLIGQALPLCASTKALTGLMSEARDWRGWKGKLRLLHSYAVERRYRNQINFVLAIGHQAIKWFRACGFPEQRIFSWGYCVEHSVLEGCAESKAITGEVVISFVGQCIERKGLSTLLIALSRLRDKDWRLQIVGDGPLRRDLVIMAERLGISNRVAFLGIKRNSEVGNILCATDFLVLPSWFDGWGAVINEALMSGTPVICSDSCGAAELIRASGHGEIFKAGSELSLTAVLEQWIEKGPLAVAHRNAIRFWSKCIEGEAFARYLTEILGNLEIGGDRPIAPWFRQEGK